VRDPHLTAEDLAALAGGRLPADVSGELRRHVARCESCMDTFLAAARAFPEQPGDVPVPDTWLQEGEAVGVLASETPSASRRGIRVAWLAAAGLAGLAVAIGWALQLGPPSSVGGVDITPIRESLAELSSLDPLGMVLPGAEDAAMRAPSTQVRSSPGAALEEETRRLFGRNEEHPEDREVASWLVRAYVAQGRLEGARTSLRDSRARFPEDRTLAVLDAYLRFRTGDLDGAEGDLVEALARDPQDHLARLNLGVLLHVRGAGGDQVRQHLERVRRDARGPLAQRAQWLLDRLDR